MKKLSFELTALAVVALLASLLSLYGLFDRSGLRKQYLLPSISADPIIDVRDHAVSFWSERMLLAGMWQQWNPFLVPFPKTMPSYSVIWSGMLTVPSGTNPKIARGLFEAVYRGGAPIGKPVETRRGVLPRMTYERRNQIKEVGLLTVEWSGVITIPADGLYFFSLTSDDGSWLYIDEQAVIDNSGIHGTRELQGSLHLSPGRHHIRVRYFDAGGDAMLKLEWKPPGGEQAPLPLELLSSDETLPVILETDSTTPLTISLAGELFTGKALHLELRPGELPVRMTLEGGGGTSLRLTWRNGELEYGPVPAGAFALPASAPPQRISIPETLIPAFVLTLALLLFVKASGRADRRFACIASACATVAYLLRFHDYDGIPYITDTMDEFNTAWVGLNFLLTGKTTGWVFPGVASKPYYIEWLANGFHLSEITFHPPVLYSLFIGLISYLSGVRDMFQTMPPFFRLPSVLFGALTTLPLMSFVRRRFSERAAILSGLLFATLPWFVLLHRLGKEEICIGFLAMTALTLLDRPKAAETAVPWPLLLVCFLAVLIKELGIFVPAFCVVTALWRKQYRLAALCASSAIIAVLLYFVWGWFLNWREFTQQILTHAKIMGQLVFVDRLLFDPRVSRMQGSGWLLWLWLSVASLSGSSRKLLLTVLTLYVAVFFFLGVAPYDFAWFRIPIMPILAVAGGVFLSRLVERAHFGEACLFLLLVVPPVIALLFTQTPESPLPPATIRIASVAVTGLVAVFGLGGKRVLGFSARLLVLAFLAANVLLVYWLPFYYNGNLGGADRPAQQLS